MKYSKKLTEEICKYISEGALNKDAAALAGIGETTFYEWQQKTLANGTDNPKYKGKFAESIKKAELLRKKKLANDIVTDKSWQAKAWYLERVHNAEFGQKSKLEVTDARDKIKEVNDLIDEKFDDKVPSQGESVVPESGGPTVPDDAGTE